MPKSKIILQKSPRKQHIIPRTYLQHFVNQQGRLFVYETGKSIRSSRPELEAVERDYFEHSLAGEKSNYEIEKFLSRVEDAGSVVHSKLLNRSQLTQDDIAAWSLYVAAMFIRSRRIRNELSVRVAESAMKECLSEDHLRDLQCDIFRTYGKLVYLSELTKIATRQAAKYEDSAYRHTQSIKYNLLNPARVLSEKRWQVVEAADGCFFSTCDAPVLSFQLVGNQVFGGCGWGIPHAHVALPLNPSMTFVASPTNVIWNSKMDCIGTDTTNRMVARFSDRNIYADRKSEGLAVVQTKFAGSLIFGENSFKVRN